MEQTRSSKQIIAHCSLMLSLAILLQFASAMFTFLGILATFFWVVPVVLAVHYDGIGGGVFVAVAASAFSFLLMGFYDGLISAYVMIGLGLFYGIRLKQKAEPGKTLLIGILASVILMAAYFFTADSFGGITVSDMMASFEQTLNDVVKDYTDAGLFDQAVKEGISVKTFKAQIMATMTVLLPSFFFVGAMIIAALNYIFAQNILKNRAEDIRALPPFIQWHLPWWCLWGLVLSLMLFVAGNFFDAEYLVTAAKNILLCYIPVLMITGISMVRFIFVKLKVGAGIQALLWIMAFFFLSVSMIFLCFLGGADAAMDYRKMPDKRNHKNNGGSGI